MLVRVVSFVLALSAAAVTAQPPPPATEVDAVVALAEAAEERSRSGALRESSALLARVVEDGAALLADASPSDALVLEGTIAEALLTLGARASGSGRHREALERYLQLANSMRLAGSREPGMPRRVLAAVRGAARAHRALAENAAAARFHERAAETAPPSDALADLVAAAEAYAAAGDRAASRRVSRLIVVRYERDPAAAEVVRSARERLRGGD